MNAPTPTAKDWLAYAKSAGYAPVLIEYIEADPANRWCPGMGRLLEQANNMIKSGNPHIAVTMEWLFIP